MLPLSVPQSSAFLDINGDFIPGIYAIFNVRFDLQSSISAGLENGNVCMTVQYMNFIFFRHGFNN